MRFGDSLPKTRSGKIMRRLSRSIAKGEEITQDLSTLENPAILDRLSQLKQPLRARSRLALRANSPQLSGCDTREIHPLAEGKGVASSRRSVEVRRQQSVFYKEISDERFDSSEHRG